jgi:type IV pilus assembly protein PilM
MSRLPQIFVSPPPSVGVEIASDRVTAVALARQGSGWIVGAHGSERLPAGLVTPALNATNVHDPRALAAAVRSTFDKLGARPRRVALVIPDTAAKLSLLRFEKVPAASDLDQLIRWQVRKAAPFKPEDAQVSWVPGAPIASGGREYLVTLARRDIVESYMRACSDAGAEAGIVDLASLNLINAAMASGGNNQTGDWLIVHVAADYATLAIVRDKQLIFFRTRPSAGPARPAAPEGRHVDSDADLADLVHQTAMYHEDRLGGARFARVVLSGASGADVGDRLRRTLEERMGVRVEPLDFRGTAAMRDRIAADADLLDALAPAVGVVLRERVA